jgi:hypothetical protein
MSYRNTIYCENTVLTVDYTLVRGNYNVVIGYSNTIKGNGCKVYGDHNWIRGHHHRVYGKWNRIIGNNNIIQWDGQHSIHGRGNWVLRESLEDVFWKQSRYEYEYWPDKRKRKT